MRHDDMRFVRCEGDAGNERLQPMAKGPLLRAAMGEVRQAPREAREAAREGGGVTRDDKGRFAHVYATDAERVAARRKSRRDSMRKQRAQTPPGRCIHGHKMTAANTYLKPSGGRECRTCIRSRRAKPPTPTVLTCPDCGLTRSVTQTRSWMRRSPVALCHPCATTPLAQQQPRVLYVVPGSVEGSEEWMTPEERETPEQTFARLTPEHQRALRQLTPIDLQLEEAEAA